MLLFLFLIFHLHLVGDTHALDEALFMEKTMVFVLFQPFQLASKYQGPLSLIEALFSNLWHPFAS
jgi:hypothetical protein